MQPLTWPAMVSLDPRLKQVDRILESYEGGDPWGLYEQAKAAMCRLVGMWAESQEIADLKTASAYEIGIAHITNTLGC